MDEIQLIVKGIIFLARPVDRNTMNLGEILASMSFRCKHETAAWLKMRLERVERCPKRTPRRAFGVAV